MASTHKGRCLCGAVEMAVTGAPEEMGFCHCGSCRSYTGAPLVAFVLFKAENVKVTKGAEAVGRFQKSETSELELRRDRPADQGRASEAEGLPRRGRWQRPGDSRVRRRNKNGRREGARW